MLAIFSSPKHTARFAGVLYLLLIIFGVFAEIYVRSGLIVNGDITSTITNITTHQTLFRLGFVSDLLMITTYFFLAITFYILFQNISKIAGSILVLSVVVAVCIMTGNMFHHFAAGMLIENPSYANLLTTAQLQASVQFHLEMHTVGYRIAQIFFGLWLFPLGYLVYKSNWFPKFLGVFLIIGCFSYLIDFFLFFLFPQTPEIIINILMFPTVIGEFGLVIYLLIFGIKKQ